MMPGTPSGRVETTLTYAAIAGVIGAAGLCTAGLLLRTLSLLVRLAR